MESCKNYYGGDVREVRKRDVLEAYFRLLKENPTESLDFIFEKLSKEKAPRFYVTFQNARVHISRSFRGKEPLYKTRETTIAQYSDLFNIWYNSLNCNLPQGKHNYEGLYEAIMHEAPSFYLSKDALRNIVYRALRKKRKE